MWTACEGIPKEKCSAETFHILNFRANTNSTITLPVISIMHILIAEQSDEISPLPHHSTLKAPLLQSGLNANDFYVDKVTLPFTYFKRNIFSPFTHPPRTLFQQNEFLWKFSVSFRLYCIRPISFARFLRQLSGCLSRRVHWKKKIVSC